MNHYDFVGGRERKVICLTTKKGVQKPEPEGEPWPNLCRQFSNWIQLDPVGNISIQAGTAKLIMS